MWYACLAEPPPGAVATGLPMAKGRSLSEFQEAFPDEACCAAFLVRRRWPNGFVCPACAGRRAAALKSRAYTYECSSCGRQTSITAGTAMHRTRLPLTTWFWAAHLMATHSNGMSARQLEDQLGVTYKTAWLLTQKLRRSMVDPDREPLEGVVEVDQAEIPFREGDAFFEPGDAGKILVIGAVEVIDRDINQSKPRRRHAKYLDTRSGRVRLAMIADNSAASIEAFVRANVKRGTTLITDGHASYPGLIDYRHDPRVIGKMAGHVVLPWVHRVFALLIPPRRPGITLASHIRALGGDLRLALSLSALIVTFLAHQAWLMSDAIARTLWRLLVTRRNLLEWVTAAQATMGPRLDLFRFYRRMAGALVIAAAAIFVAWLSDRGALPLAAPFAALWFASPAVARWASLPPRVAGKPLTSDADTRDLRLTARRTWRFFETFVTPTDRMLPPDNFQEDPPALAHRTSPTNLGL